jgi:hypothetical protein
MLDAERQIDASLAELDSLFVNFYSWLACQYDPRSGGFFYARSSKDSGEFEADIESTFMALSVLERSSILRSIPAKMRKGLVAYFQARQDPKTGLFLDPDPAMREDEVMVARAMSFSLHSLKMLGGSPLYPLPKAADEPPYMATTETYLKWLASVDLRNAWRGCDFMMSANHYIERKSAAEREAFVEAARLYFAGIQDPETGLFGAGNTYTRISGTFKMNMFYKIFRVPMPRVEAIRSSVLSCLREEEARDMCWIRNPVDLLASFRDRITLKPEELAEVLAITAANMKALLRADGGFSRELEGSPVAPNVAQVKEGDYYPNMPIPVRLGKGLVEGDMNAGTQAVLIRNFARELSGRQPEPMAGYAADFTKAAETLG